MNNPETYISHSLNISKTKEAHVFPRSKRFHTEKTRYATLNKSTTEAFYDLPSTIVQRTTTLGYGNKTNMAMKTISPPPGSYQPISEFERKNYRNITSLGQGRQKVTFGSFLIQAMKRSKQSPSPSKYNVPNYRSTIGGRMGERIKTDLELKYKKSLPGPGTYKLDSIQIKNKGFYVLSNYKNASSPRLCATKNPTNTIRNKKSDHTISYDIQQKKIGTYPTSKLENLISHSFSKAKRQGLEDKSKLSIPGCKYRRFSDFGGVQL